MTRPCGPRPLPGQQVTGRASSHLKLWPVHGHAWPVVGSEPPQVLHRVGSFDALLQVSVNVFVAKSERERSVTLFEGREGQPSASPRACPELAPRSAAARESTSQGRPDPCPGSAGRSSGRDAHRTGQTTTMAWKPQLQLLTNQTRWQQPGFALCQIIQKVLASGLHGPRICVAPFNQVQN